MAERDRTLTVTLELDYFGHDDTKERQHALRSLVRVLSTSLGDCFRITDSTGHIWTAPQGSRKDNLTPPPETNV